MGANQYGSFGFPSMVNRSSKKSFRKKTNNINSTIIRVTSVITTPPIEGGEALIGIVSGEEVTADGIPTRRIINGVYPAENYRTIMPIVNEFVPIHFTVAPNRPKGRWVYGPPIALYGISSQNVNSSPSPLENPNPPTQTLDYSQAFTGAPNILSNNEFELDYNSSSKLKNTTFIERGNIHPLLPFEGDILYEGRWGHSIRFGSTVKSKNSWSKSGTNGDPILILRNGQDPNSSDFGSEPIIENIKKDLSSIYLTSTQQLEDFSLANENFSSYIKGTEPETPARYTKPQIAFNSSRIVLNATSDSILISGEKSINLSSNKSINIEAKQIYFSGNDIRLGNPNASQPVLKGNQTVDYLKILIKELKNLTTALKTVKDWPSGIATPNTSLTTTTRNALNTFEKVYNNIDTIKSNFVKTI